MSASDTLRKSAAQIYSDAQHYAQEPAQRVTRSCPIADEAASTATSVINPPSAANAVTARFPDNGRALRDEDAIVNMAADVYGDAGRQTVLQLWEGMQTVAGSNPARVTNLAKFAPKLYKSLKGKSEGGAMRSFHNSSFDPQTLVLLETAFDEAWLTLKSTLR